MMRPPLGVVCKRGSRRAGFVFSPPWMKASTLPTFHSFMGLRVSALLKLVGTLVHGRLFDAATHQLVTVAPGTEQPLPAVSMEFFAGSGEGTK